MTPARRLQGLSLITQFCLITLATAQKACASSSAPFVALPRISVAGVFGPSIDSVSISPTLTGFVVPRDRTSIFNDHPKDQIVAKVWTGIGAVQLGKWNFVRNIQDVLPRRYDRRTQKIVVANYTQRWGPSVSLVSARDADSLDDASQFSTVGNAVIEMSAIPDKLRNIVWPGSGSEEHTWDGASYSPNKYIGTLQLSERSFGDLGLPNGCVGGVFRGVGIFSGNLELFDNPSLIPKTPSASAAAFDFGMSQLALANEIKPDSGKPQANGGNRKNSSEDRQPLVVASDGLFGTFLWTVCISGVLFILGRVLIYRYVDSI